MSLILSCDVEVALVVIPHEVCDLHHLAEVMGDVLLVVDAEETVSNVIMDLLLVLLQSLDYAHVGFHAFGRLLVLAYLLLKSFKCAFQVLNSL